VHPVRIVASVFGFVAIGSFAGVLTQQGYLWLTTLHGVPDLSPANSWTPEDSVDDQPPHRRYILLNHALDILLYVGIIIPIYTGFPRAILPSYRRVATLFTQCPRVLFSDTSAQTSRWPSLSNSDWFAHLESHNPIAEGSALASSTNLYPGIVHCVH
jgi:hypothetical protein